MSGRGDNNKHGSAGRGASNQSNQPFVASDEKPPASNHNRNATGGKPSEPQKKSKSTAADRNSGKPSSSKK